MIFDDVYSRQGQQDGCDNVEGDFHPFFLSQVIQAFPTHSGRRHDKGVGEKHVPPASVHIGVLVNDVEGGEEEGKENNEEDLRINAFPKPFDQDDERGQSCQNRYGDGH